MIMDKMLGISSKTHLMSKKLYHQSSEFETNVKWSYFIAHPVYQKNQVSRFDERFNSQSCFYSSKIWRKDHVPRQP